MQYCKNSGPQILLWLFYVLHGFCSIILSLLFDSPFGFIIGFSFQFYFGFSFSFSFIGGLLPLWPLLLSLVYLYSLLSTSPTPFPFLIAMMYCNYLLLPTLLQLQLRCWFSAPVSRYVGRCWCLRSFLLLDSYSTVSRSLFNFFPSSFSLPISAFCILHFPLLELFHWLWPLHHGHPQFFSWLIPQCFLSLAYSTCQCLLWFFLWLWFICQSLLIPSPSTLIPKLLQYFDFDFGLL